MEQLIAISSDACGDVNLRLPMVLICIFWLIVVVRMVGGMEDLAPWINRWEDSSLWI